MHFQLASGFVVGGVLDEVFPQTEASIAQDQSPLFTDSVSVPPVSSHPVFTHPVSAHPVSAPLVSGQELQPKSFSSQRSEDEFWMKEALREGMRGAGIASPNPSVGCVLVESFGVSPAGTFVSREAARGCTQAYGGWHGERSAFENLKKQKPSADAHGITAYVTLEPCSHVGKQPPCANLLVEKKVKRVVIAASDPHPLVNGQGIEKLRAAGIEVEVGLMLAESVAWNLPFFLSAIGKRVTWAAKWAQSLDGCLADDQGGWKWITGPRARAYSHWLRQKYDAIVVGAGTVLSDFPDLRPRDCWLAGQSLPTKVIFDPKGRLLSPSEEQKNLLRQKTLAGKEGKLIFVSDGFHLDSKDPRTDSKWVREMQDELGVVFLEPPRSASGAKIGGEVAQDAVQSFVTAIESFDFACFRGKPLQSVFVEGGPQLLSQMIERNIFDVFHVFLAPFLLGGLRNRIAQTHRNGESNGNKGTATSDLDAGSFLSFPRSLSGAERWQVIAQESLGPDLLLEMLPERTALQVGI